MNTLATLRSTTLSSLVAAAALTAGADEAQAAPAEANAGAELTTSTPNDANVDDGDSSREIDDSEATPWIKRYRPVRNSWELGLYGGIFVPSLRHEVYEADSSIPGFGHQELARIGPDIGARVGYYPLSFLGLELEGGVIPTKAADNSRATLYTARPVLLAQLPYRVAPFVRAGFGITGISADVLGKDIDPALNIGGGVKFYINRLLMLRLDIVDNVMTAYGVGNERSNNLEVLLGLSVRLGKRAEDPVRELRDTDGDGLYDPGQPGVAAADEDQCPNQPGPRDNRGCPLIDSDGDGLFDPGQLGVPAGTEDLCPQDPGPQSNRGCPLIDTDGDGLFDPGQPVPDEEVDICPQEPGPRDLQGCPDADGDRIIDSLDKCPQEPEVYNQVDDHDGCPDEVPKEVKKMTGVLRGIFFDVDKDTIKPISKSVLDNAVKVLSEFPDTRWEIQGHTDSDGTREHNMDLSQRRAESVRTYLTEHGIDGARLVPLGVGPDKPLDSNATKRGKARNRRIEFKLID